MVTIRKLLLSIILFSLFLALAACQASSTENGPIPSNNNEPNDNEENEPEEEEEIVIQMDPYEIETEPAGELYLEYINGKDSKPGAEYSSAKDETIEAFIDRFKAMDEKMYDTPEKIAAITIELLRTDINDYMDQLRAFEATYDDITLPDGRKVSSIKEEDFDEEPPKTNVAIILDASGSMNAAVDGGIKMDLARKSLQAFTKDLPAYVNVALYVFGHVGSGEESDKELSCTTIDNIYELAPYDDAIFSEAMDSFEAKGWTPIAGSLETVKDDLVAVSDDDTKNIIYLISDGVETCDGDPVQTVKNVKKDIDEVTINIIGFDVNDAADKLLRDIADAGNGKYNTAQNANQLSEAIADQWHEKISYGNLTMWGAFEVIDLGVRGNKLYNEFDAFGGPLGNSVNLQIQRMDTALSELHSNEIVDYDTMKETRTIVRERNRNLYDYVKDLRKSKRDTIGTNYDKMKATINRIEEEYGD